MKTNLVPLAGAVIPDAFVGSWTPDPNVYGNLLSGPINVTSEFWTGDTSGAPAYPQFATDKGQQIGNLFFLYGTYGGPPSVTPGSSACGFLMQQGPGGKIPPQVTPGVVGLGTIEVANPFASWAPLAPGNVPFVAMAIPTIAPSGPTLQQNIQTAVNALEAALKQV